MIRYKATGETMVWRPTGDGHGGRRLMPVDGGFESPIAYWYPPPSESSTWVSGHESLGAQVSPQALEALLVERGIIEVFDDPPAADTAAEKDYDSAHRADEADEVAAFDAYVDALAVVAAFEPTPLSIRVAAINELRRLLRENR